MVKKNERPGLGETEFRVAFNAVPLLSPLTGIGQYTRSLLQNLDRISGVKTHKFYAGGWSRSVRETPLPLSVNRLKSLVRRGLPNSYGVSRFFQQQNFNKGIKRFRPDVYHEPNYLAFRFDGPTVITVHDLSWIRYPETHPPERVSAMNRYFEPALRRATCVITDSEFIKREVVETFGLNPQRVHAIALGADDVFRPQTAETSESVMAVHDLKYGEYWLSVGTLEPRKNLPLLLDAFSRLPAAIRRKCPLVLVGIHGWLTSPLQRLLDPLIRSGEVRQLGYLGREDLATVIAGAKAVVYPSVYEGFGLPPLEAMSCGVPVIASSVSSLPEVVGDAGLMIDPNDVLGLTESMLQVFEDESLRRQMSQKGLARSRGFSWQSCAELTIGVYKAAML